MCSQIPDHVTQRCKAAGQHCKNKPHRRNIFLLWCFFILIFALPWTLALCPEISFISKGKQRRVSLHFLSEAIVGGSGRWRWRKFSLLDSDFRDARGSSEDLFCQACEIFFNSVFFYYDWLFCFKDEFPFEDFPALPNIFYSDFF